MEPKLAQQWDVLRGDLHGPVAYGHALEDPSTRIMPFIEHSIDDSDGSPSVHNERAHLYRYSGLTVQIEALCGNFEWAVKTELVEPSH